MTTGFHPITLLKNGAVQTIASLYWPQVRLVGGVESRHFVAIPPHGLLAVVENRPVDWDAGGPIVLLVHGLTGSENSSHQVRLAHAFVKRGVLVVRMNMRGCGPGEGLASGIYHSGRSEDTRAILEWIGATHPGSPVSQIGISLGGNATLKMAGEYGAGKPDFLDSVVSVSAPIDLAACSARLSHWRNILFDRYFSTKLVHHVGSLHERFPDKVPPLPSIARRKTLSLAQFDDIYTGPVSGFRNAQHYYQECSSGPVISNIHCGLLLLTSDDDPIIISDAYRELKLSKHHDLMITSHGGHAAWIGRSLADEFGHFWMDRIVVKWVLNRFSGKNNRR